ncbi:surfeit locus protein 2 isoform X1 [Cinnamomum micranthum f. kanehirae]|uniref:Surfeit locus protein 2 isoform X1 n=1 Tax=Cinnamomum micranthum f. kanehirae TaxID=337451 RepID=A0A443Q224_9MAGN|nr:surfeit locus protein 2 isoform X1 [Cinnamomum micranthum f. kanehirae]
MSQEEKTKAKKKKKTTEKAENFLEEAEEEPSKAEMKKEEEAKEGHFLLGPPTFTQLENGRFRCSETGHEMPSKEMESYGRSKRCRVGLIDAFLQLNKAPLNSFYQDPLCKSKLICKLTGDTINKSEEHIWKHISGKRFQHKLEQKEAEKATPAVMEEKKEKLSPKASKLSKKSITKDVKGKVRKGDSQAKEHLEKSSDSEELDFWVPPVGSRWDFDDGADRWGSSADSGDEKDEGIGIDEADEGEQDGVESEELSMRTKRMSIAIGPSSFASRKKKKRTESTCDATCN